MDEAATLSRLKRAAAYYLGRYASSTANLREVLRRQVRRRARRLGTEAAPALALVEAAVAFCVETGLVDDAAFARGRAATLRQRGWPMRRIALALRQKGLCDADIRAALGEPSSEDELAAARRFAERRRLGPWRLRDREERRQKDIAALARAGFAPSLARQVIEGKAVN